MLDASKERSGYDPSMSRYVCLAFSVLGGLGCSDDGVIGQSAGADGTAGSSNATTGPTLTTAFETTADTSPTTACAAATYRTACWHGTVRA